MKEISLGSKTCRSKSWQKLHMNHLDLPTPMKQTAEARDRVSPEFACGGGSPLRSLLGKSTLRRNLGEVEIRHRNTYCTVVGSRNTFRSNSQRLFFFGSSGRNIFCQMLHLFQWVENLLGEANGRKERFLWAFQAISATKNSTCLCLLYQKRSNAYYNSILASCYIYIYIQIYNIYIYGYNPNYIPLPRPFSCMFIKMTFMDPKNFWPQGWFFVVKTHPYQRKILGSQTCTVSFGTAISIASGRGQASVWPTAALAKPRSEVGKNGQGGKNPWAWNIGDFEPCLEMTLPSTCIWSTQFEQTLCLV